MADLEHRVTAIETRRKRGIAVGLILIVAVGVATLLKKPPPSGPAAHTVDQVSKQAANYRLATGAEKCSNCRFFVSGNYCTKVKGLIDPNFTSDLWQSL